MSSPRRASRPSLGSANMEDLRTSLVPDGSSRRSLLKKYKTKKILIMGYNNTGKSSITLKFLYDFPDASNLGPEENYHTSIKYRNENFLLHIVDFAGLDEYTPIYTSKHGVKVDGYILIYSVDNRRSFEFVQELREKLRSLNGKQVPYILVANKCDLHEARQVSTEEGKRLAKALGIEYLEVSAHRHSTDVIKKVFEVMLKEVVKAENQENELKRLKNWDIEKVEQLCRLFIFSSVLVLLIGIFFVMFGVMNLLVYPELIETQEIMLFLLILNGFILCTLSSLGTWGMRKEEHDSILVFMLLVIVSVLLDVGCIVLKCLSAVEDNDKYNPTSIATEEYRSLDPLLYSIIGISFVLLIFLLMVSSVSKEIFIKKKISTGSRFAALRV